MNTPKNENEEPNIDQLIAIGGIRDMNRDQAKAFLDQKRTFIAGRGIAAEYKSLAFEYSEIGEKGTAAELIEAAKKIEAQND